VELFQLADPQRPSAGALQT